jgi:hypothetical protein
LAPLKSHRTFTLNKEIMEKQQTAVEWLIENIYYLHSTKWNDIIEQAKEIEQEQIMNAWVKGVVSEGDMTARQYYKETYK